MSSPSKASYKVLGDGPVAGVFRTAGQILQMTEAEAKYLLLADVIAPADPDDAAPAEAEPDTKTRRKVRAED